MVGHNTKMRQRAAWGRRSVGSLASTRSGATSTSALSIRFGKKKNSPATLSISLSPRAAAKPKKQKTKNKVSVNKFVHGFNSIPKFYLQLTYLFLHRFFFQCLQYMTKKCEGGFDVGSTAISLDAAARSVKIGETSGLNCYGRESRGVCGANPVDLLLWESIKRA